IVGSSMAEGLGYRYSTNAKGLVRAYDARTGKQIWRFNTIPYPGEPGNETWENGSWEWTGNNGVWTQITVDPEAGLVYLPVESPTIDEYGGNRPGNNLYAESLVAVDLKTGKKKWHFQLVHHPIWDHDISVRSRRSRDSSTRSNGSPASRSGRCRKKRCRRATCRARRHRRRSRFP